MYYDEVCCVVDQHCERPANLLKDREEPNRRLPECYRCGQSVCVSCSSRRKYLKYGIVRLCNHCQEEEDRTPWHVIRRMALMSGYNLTEATKHANQYDTPTKAKAKEVALQQKIHADHKARLAKSSKPCLYCEGTGKQL